MDNLIVFVPETHFKQVSIENLVSDQEHQRKLSKSHIQRTVKSFDLYQIKPVKVSRPDGINYVFNGSHTVEATADTMLFTVKGEE